MAASSQSSSAQRPDIVNELSLRILLEGGYSLGATLYQPDTGNGRAVIVVGALAVKQTYYAAFARHLAAQGFAVLSFDYRGFGTSRPARLRGSDISLSGFIEHDLPAAIDWLGARYPQHKLFAVSHSLGGQLIGLAKNSGRLEAAVMVASPSGYWRHYSRPQRYLLAALWHGVVPAATHAFGHFPAGKLGLGEDLPKQVALEWAAACRHPHYLAGRSGSARHDAYARFAAPIRAYVISDDGYAPPRAVDALLDYYRNARIERRLLTPAELGVRKIGHFGFFREQPGRPLWDECAAWLSAG